MEYQLIQIDNEVRRLKEHVIPIVINPHWILYQAAVSIDSCRIIFTPEFWTRFKSEHPEVSVHSYPGLELLVDTRGDIVYRGPLNQVEEEDVNLLRPSSIPSPPLPTIVTALYPIRALENNSSQQVKSIETYLEKGKIIASWPYPMVIYTQAELVDAIYALRKPYISMTRIIVEPLEQTYFYRYKDTFTKHPFPIYNINSEKDTPLYIIFNANKFHWMERTIKANPFNSTHFLWIDLGIAYVARNPALAYTWLSHMPDRIRQMEVVPYFGEPAQDHFHYIRHNLAGGLFSGHYSYLTKYISAFKAKYQEIIDAGWYQLDEAVMTLVAHDHPDWFDFFYGDYEGIIQNYRAPHSNLNLIIHGLDECIRRKEYIRAKERLNYLESVINQELVERYLRVDNHMRTSVVDYLHRFKLLEPEAYKSWYQNHEDLIKPYRDLLPSLE